MKVLTYTLATGLLLFSLFALSRHFRPFPKYVSWLLDNPLDWMAIRGLFFPLTVAASIYVCLGTYFDPSQFWLKMTVLLIGINIVLHILMFWWTYQMTKPDYEERKRNGIQS